MISPWIRMHGFASPSFPRLAELASGRDMGGDHEVHVLHDAGTVLAAVDTRSGRVPFEPGEEPLSLARRLRQERVALRVVVADRGPLRDAIAAAESKVRPDTPQPVLMMLMQQAFRDCPGVVCEPPLADLAGWHRLKEHLHAVGHGLVVIAAAEDGTWPIALLGRLEDGLVVELTDLPQEAVDLLPDLEAVGASLGSRVALALVTTHEGLREVLLAPDVAGALLDALQEKTGGAA